MTRTPDETFGLEVRALREQKGWSMTEFAGMLAEAGLTNFHPTTVGRLERGERPVRLNEAVIIAAVLGESLNEMVAEPFHMSEERWFRAVEDLEHSVLKFLIERERLAHNLEVALPDATDQRHQTLRAKLALTAEEIVAKTVAAHARAQHISEEEAEVLRGVGMELLSEEPARSRK